MNRAWLLAGVHRRMFLALTALGFVGLAGCHGMPWSEKEKVQGRSQVGEDPIAELDASTTIGSKTTIGNTESILVSGVGLVYNLPGTGSSAPPGGWRMMLEHSLKKNQRLSGHLRELLDDPRKTTSLVLVTAAIPPGRARATRSISRSPCPTRARRPASRAASSIRANCTPPTRRAISARWSRTASHQRRAATSRSATCGRWARGRCSPASSSRRTASPLRPRRTPTASRSTSSAASGAARRWSAPGRTIILLNPGDQNPRTAYNIAERLNSTFHATSEPNLKVGEAKTKELILANVPFAYRHNHYRFLLVDSPGADSADAAGQRVPAEAGG